MFFSLMAMFYHFPMAVFPSELILAMLLSLYDWFLLAMQYLYSSIVELIAWRVLQKNVIIVDYDE